MLRMQMTANGLSNAPSVNRRIVCIALILIVLLGLALRFLGLPFGFPYLFHPDEPTAVRAALAFFKGDFNPRSFKMPSLFLYLLYFSYWIYYRLTGASSLPHLWSNQLPFYHIGRLWSVILGTATVLVVFFAGRKLYSLRGALGAALLIAVLPLHVLHSHYATVDVPVTFLITLSFLFSIFIYQRGRGVDYLGAGLCSGLAAGMKYNGALTILPLLVAHLLRLRREKTERASSSRRSKLFSPLLGLAAAGLAFLASSPFIVKESARFLADLNSQSHYLIHYGHGPIFIHTGPGFWYHLRYTLYYCGGAVFWCFSIAGIVFAAFRHKDCDLLIFSWLVPYFILISIPVVKFSRFLIPLLPFLALLGGRLLDIRFPRAWQNRLGLIVFLVGSFWIFLYATGFALLLTRRDARIEAKTWIEDKLPQGARVGMVKTETGLIFLDDPPLTPGHPQLKVEYYQRLLPALQAAPEYLIVTDFDYRQILRLEGLYDQKRADLWKTFLGGKEGYRKLREFHNRPRFCFFNFGGPFPPHDMMYNWPRISLYQRN